MDGVDPLNKTLERWITELRIQYDKRVKLWITLSHIFTILFVISDQFVKTGYWFNIDDLLYKGITHEHIIIIILVSLIVNLYKMKKDKNIDPDITNGV